MTIWKMPPPPGSDTGQPPAEIWDGEGVRWTPVFLDATEWVQPESGERKPWPDLLFEYGPISDNPELDYA